MFIQPNSTIELFSGIPLDNTYEHSIYFASAGAQNSFFTDPVKTFHPDSYQRVNSGRFQAQCVADEIYNCNYMRFQNTAFGSKWFYAFITGIDYINNGNSEVRYEIDVIQTYLVSDVSLKTCYIERQHTQTDFLFQWQQPEPVVPQEYVFQGYTNGKDLWNGAYCIVVGTVEIADDDQPRVSSGNVYDGVYGGISLHLFHANAAGVAGVNDLITRYTVAGKADGVILMYMCPLLAAGAFEDGAIIAYQDGAAGYSFSMDPVTTNTTLDGYKPKNKKLYSYPYNFAHIDNGNGQSLQLRYELCGNGIPQFHTYCSITSPVQVVIYPVNYKRAAGILNTECLTMTDYPLCSWNYDTFSDWLARAAAPTAISAIPNVIGNLTNPQALAGQAAGFLANAASAYFAPDQVKGNIGGVNVKFSAKQNYFNVARCCASLDDARAIDDFFDKYGYAINRLDKPLLNARPHWTYIKTRECVAVGSCPADDIKKICNIFNNGITFWKNGSEVGNYTLDNTV